MREDKNAKLPANAGKPWDEEADQQLLYVLRSRKSQKHIAHRLERTEEEVFMRVASVLNSERNSGNEMHRLLREAVDFEAVNFDADEPVSGADLVEFIARWRLNVKDMLRTIEIHPAPESGK